MAKKVEKKEETKKENKTNVHEVTVKIEGKDWEAALDKAFAKKQKTAKVDGFRAGKVPRDIYEKHYGKESLFLEAADECVQTAFLKAMDDSKLVPVVQPTVDLKSIDESGAEYVFKIITKPEVNVKKYKGLEIKKEKVKVTDEKVNEEKELNLTFPKDYGVADLAGQDVVFKVKVNEIKQKVTRELDEDFFEDLGMEGVDSEDKLKEEIKKSIEAQKEMDAENKYIDKILEEVGKNVEVDIPQEMVDEEVDRLIKRFEEQMKMQGISLDLYYQFTQSTEKDLRNQMEKEAYSNVLYRLMLEEITKLEKIVVSEEDADKEAEDLAKKYNMDKEDFLKEFGGVEMVKYDLEMRKTIEKLKELNK